MKACSGRECARLLSACPPCAQAGLERVQLSCNVAQKRPGAGSGEGGVQREEQRQRLGAPSEGRRGEESNKKV